MKLVALKIHYINQSWSENCKQSYVKHAIRESNTHQRNFLFKFLDLNHKNIVKMLDIV